MIKDERANFKIVGRRTIRSLHTCVSNTVRLFLPDAPDACSISFSETFVEFIGKSMPQGVGPYNPVFLYVTMTRGKYNVIAAYLKQPETTVKLWRTEKRPAWIPEKPNAQSTATKQVRRDLQAYRAYQERRAIEALAASGPGTCEAGASEAKFVASDRATPDH